MRRISASAVTASASASYDSDSRWRRHVGREIRHVLGQHVGASAQERERARALDQVDGRARARAIGDVASQIGDAVAFRVARCRGEPHRVVHQRRIHVAGAALALQRGELVGRGHGGDLLRERRSRARRSRTPLPRLG